MFPAGAFRLLLSICFLNTVSAGKVLAWPADTSHFLNLRIILEELAHKGHDVTVLVHSAMMVTLTDNTSPLKYEHFSVPFTKEKNEKFLDEFLAVWIYDVPKMSYWEFYEEMKKLTAGHLRIQEHVCNGVVKNELLLKKLKEKKFDVVISDPLEPCGELLAELLGVPFVYSFRFSLGNSMERLCGQLPAPFSYVPGSMVELTDKMSFVERLKNMNFYIFQDILFHLLFAGKWDGYFSEALAFCSLKDMEKIAQSSGEHGMIVFSLGSMVKNLTDERSNVIAAALSQLPQKVIWRYRGKRPSALGKNTVLYDWIPQNDLLGTNGIYEAIYHGVPMVGIPLFADQPDNIIHMKTKGMAVMLDINKMQSQDLVDAVNTVMNDPSYKENALRISQIHHDQPVKPLDRAVFWIEFVMRHKGAKHLRPAAHDLTWYQYHCLDVIGFLLVCLFIIIFIIMKIFSFCCRKCRPAKRKQKKH
ncbi:hypothetical protein GDO78_012224 [Eleutherodactylus coqui]|uniref:UDP-glucuronosyltransferase n=1 Tax=Eleutherodactylus coqui TaxID=57060 RepID=A0A8J6F5D7_ELECQ|nr:hypothetical protein GDO78_012224 [Eleutherodactylus coqui]